MLQTTKKDIKLNIIDNFSMDLDINESILRRKVDHEDEKWDHGMYRGANNIVSSPIEHKISRLFCVKKIW
jgi:hypothetical protein